MLFASNGLPSQTPGRIQKIDLKALYLHQRSFGVQNWGFICLDPPRGLGCHAGSVPPLVLSQTVSWLVLLVLLCAGRLGARRCSLYEIGLT